MEVFQQKINAIKAHFEKNTCVSMCGLEFILQNGTFVLQNGTYHIITYYDNI